MKFGLYIKNKSIPEWRSNYLNYKCLKKILSPIKIIRKKYFKIEYNGLTIQNIDNKHLKEILNIKKIFKDTILEQIKQISEFFNLILINSILVKFIEIKLNLNYLETKRKSLNNIIYKKHLNNIKLASEKLFKEIIYLTEYTEVNNQGFYKILKKYKKITKEFPNKKFDLDFIEEFNESYKNSDYSNYKFLLSKINTNLEIIYLKSFFNEGTKNDIRKGNARLRVIQNKNNFTQAESFYLGTFLGISFILFIVLIIILIKNNYLDFENKVFGDVYPVFRGSLLFILYIFFLGINILVFNKYNVNFSLVFKFNEVNMTPINYLTLSFFFIFMWLVIFNIYLIVLAENFNQNVIYFVDFLPPLIWLFIIIYILFPFKIFKYKSRLFLLYIIKEYILSPFYRSDFLIAWITDQTLSFVTSLKDFAYTICYVVQLNRGSNYSQCLTNTAYMSFEVIIIFFPLFLRVSHCLRNVIKFNKEKMIEQRNNNFLNMIKYTWGILTSISSLLVWYVPDFFYVWIVFVIITTMYSYVWDVKKDWGFFEKNSKNKFLRNHLSYDNKIFYYFGLFFNLVMRLAWILSISAFVGRNIQRKILGFFIGLTEIIRRSIWNFFRIENEHLKYVGNFNAIGDNKLPFKFISDLENKQKYKFIDKEINLLIENDIEFQNKEDQFIFNKSYGSSRNFSNINESLSRNIDIKKNSDNLCYKKLKSINSNKLKQEEKLRKKIKQYKLDFKDDTFKIKLNQVKPIKFKNNILLNDLVIKEENNEDGSYNINNNNLETEENKLINFNDQKELSIIEKMIDSNKEENENKEDCVIKKNNFIEKNIDSNKEDDNPQKE